MCLGGPNHCRVGRAGSQSYLLSLIVVKHMLLLWYVVCRLAVFILLAFCSSSGY
jgi:hypothetical protein